MPLNDNTYADNIYSILPDNIKNKIHTGETKQKILGIILQLIKLFDKKNLSEETKQALICTTVVDIFQKINNIDNDILQIAKKINELVDDIVNAVKNEFPSEKTQAAERIASMIQKVDGLVDIENKFSGKQLDSIKEQCSNKLIAKDHVNAGLDYWNEELRRLNTRLDNIKRYSNNNKIACSEDIKSFTNKSPDTSFTKRLDLLRGIYHRLSEAKTTLESDSENNAYVTYKSKKYKDIIDVIGSLQCAWKPLFGQALTVTPTIDTVIPSQENNNYPQLGNGELTSKNGAKDSKQEFLPTDNSLLLKKDNIQKILCYTSLQQAKPSYLRERIKSFLKERPHSCHESQPKSPRDSLYEQLQGIHEDCIDKKNSQDVKIFKRIQAIKRDNACSSPLSWSNKLKKVYSSSINNIHSLFHSIGKKDKQNDLLMLESSSSSSSNASSLEVLLPREPQQNIYLRTSL